MGRRFSRGPMNSGKDHGSCSRVSMRMTRGAGSGCGSWADLNARGTTSKRIDHDHELSPSFRRRSRGARKRTGPLARPLRRRWGSATPGDGGRQEKASRSGEDHHGRENHLSAAALISSPVAMYQSGKRCQRLRRIARARLLCLRLRGFIPGLQGRMATPTRPRPDRPCSGTCRGWEPWARHTTAS